MRRSTFSPWRTAVAGAIAVFACAWAHSGVVAQTGAGDVGGWYRSDSGASDGSPALAGYGRADEVRHVCLTFPVPRVGADCTARSPQKVGPCGVAGRSQNVNEFQPGESITVRFNETVNHPSHYRISFNPNGDAFPDPTSVDDKSGGPLVLHDGIADDEASAQEIRITFPDVECANCTLQLIQVMYDKGGNGFGGRTADGGNDDIYYSCADVVLRRR